MTDSVALERAARTLGDRYRVDRLIGEGGMATVYRARDLKHDRDVALKILKPELGAVLGPERFLSEIRVTARLQHPNLLPLFDSGDADGMLYYVMPYVEGESLRARLDRERQLSLEETLHIATSVASALDYAHAHEVVHRDLKPENILLQSGQPLIADFGIALAVSVAGGQRVTQTGLSLGTPQYMSPEQATGDRSIDRRSDIYSLGAVVYEMLAGEPPHTGGTVQAIIGKVVTERARSLRLVRPAIPEHVDLAVQTALEKVPADRWASAGEFAEALRGRARSYPTASAASSAAAVTDFRTWRDGLRDPLVIGALTFGAIGLGAAAWTSTSRDAEPLPRAVRFVLAPAGDPLPVGGASVDISPDGQLISFLTTIGGSPALAIRPLDSLAPRQLARVSPPAVATFSPDGKWLAFISAYALHKVAVTGGPVLQLAEWTQPPVSLYGAAWGQDGIVVGSERGLYVVPAAGGEPRLFAPVDSAAGETFRAAPKFIPGRRTVLFTSGRRGTQDLRIAAATLDGKTVDLGIAVADFDITALGVAEGHLLYATGGVLMAVPFDSRTLRTKGDAVPVLDHVYGIGEMALSRTGNLVYRMGSHANQPVLVTRDGVTPMLAVGQYRSAVYSPDGRNVALTLRDRDKLDIAVYDVATQTLRRLTTDGRGNDRPEWTPDGSRIIYRSNRKSEALWWQLADGSGSPELLLERAGGVQEGALTGDGKGLVYRSINAGTGRDILFRALSGDTTERSLANTPASESHIALSPDSRFLAYQSNESGDVEVFVRSLQGPGSKWRVSTNGGSAPVWSRDGTKLYYFGGQAIVAASVSTARGFTITARDTLATGGYYRSNSHRSFDATPDGSGVLALRFAGGEIVHVVVVNWITELREKLGIQAMKPR